MLCSHLSTVWCAQSSLVHSYEIRVVYVMSIHVCVRGGGGWGEGKIMGGGM